MKTTVKFFALAFVLFATACSNDDEIDMFDSLWRNVTQNEARIDALEKWCAQANTNISSLQTLVKAIEEKKTISNILPIVLNGDTIGYTMNFGDKGPITIYDDSNPVNAPKISVKSENDVYYWTLNGEWLLDENGNKLRVSGEDGKDGKDGEDGVDGADGKDGENGKDGADGQNGTNGQNGITPQLKIENDYWYISYNNGNTWTELGKAKGEDGQDGVDGANGQAGEKGEKGDTGDSMFRSVTQDADNVYFTLADGTVITIAKGGGGADDGGCLFTITYMPNGGEGEMKVDTVRYGCSYTIKSCTFTYPAYGFVEWNTATDGKGFTYFPAESIVAMKNIILYAQWSDCAENGYVWIDLGLSVKWATCNVGALSPIESGDYFAWGETEPKTTYNWSTYKWCNGGRYTQTKYCTSSEYGTVDNKTVLELADDAARANWGGKWRMPTDDEWTELRKNCTWTWTSDYNGTGVAGRIVTSKINGNSIFLPAAGDDGNYWSSSLETDYPFRACNVIFYSDLLNRVHWARYIGQSVRPVIE